MEHLTTIVIVCLVLSVACLLTAFITKQREAVWLRNEWLKSIKETQNRLNEQAHLVGMVKDNQDARERLLKELKNEE